MAINTAEERKSISGVNYIAGPGVTPEGSQDAQWRQEVGYGYAGIIVPEIDRNRRRKILWGSLRRCI